VRPTNGFIFERTFGFEALACSRCGGQLRLVALIEQASVVQRILRHLGLPTEVPEPRSARAPTRRLDQEARRSVPVTVPNSMLLGEGVASREEGCRRVASFLFPYGHFPLVFPADLAIIGRRQGPYSALS
jgi:hypothetical protein